METLRKPCESCHKPMNGGLYRAAHVCPHCGFEHATTKSKKSSAFRKQPSLTTATATPAQPQEVAQKPAPQKAFSGRGPAGLPEVEEDVQPAAAESVYAEPVQATAVEQSPAEPATDYATESEPETAMTEPAPLAEAPHETSLDDEQVIGAGSETGAEQDDRSAAIAANEAQTDTDATADVDPNRARDVALTVKPADEQNVVAYFESVTSEQVITLPLTADLFESGKFLGTKSHKVKAVLQQGKKQALAELRNMAYDMGANMVASINLENKLKVIDKQTAEVRVIAVGSAISAELVEEAMEA